MSRTTIVIAAGALIISAYAYIVVPLEAERTDIKERVQAQYDSLVKHEKFLVRTQKAGIEVKDALKQLQEMEKYIIHAQDTSLAIASLQSRIQDLAGAAGLEVTSFKPLQAIEYEGYRGLPLYVEVTGGINNLSRFFNYLDSSWESIGIDSLNVSLTSQDTLRIKMQLSGLMKT